MWRFGRCLANGVRPLTTTLGCCAGRAVGFAPTGVAGAGVAVAGRAGELPGAEWGVFAISLPQRIGRHQSSDQNTNFIMRGTKTNPERRSGTRSPGSIRTLSIPASVAYGLESAHGGTKWR